MQITSIKKISNLVTDAGKSYKLTVDGGQKNFIMSIVKKQGHNYTSTIASLLWNKSLFEVNRDPDGKMFLLNKCSCRCFSHFRSEPIKEGETQLTILPKKLRQEKRNFLSLIKEQAKKILGTPDEDGFKYNAASELVCNIYGKRKRTLCTNPHGKRKRTLCTNPHGSN